MRRQFDAYSKVLIGLAVLALLAAGGVLLLASPMVEGVLQKDMYLLKSVYEPAGNAGHEENPTYEELYPLAERMGEQRNGAIRRFFHLTVGSLLILGGVLVIWVLDREKLRRRAART